MTIALDLPRPRSDQLEIIRHPARRKNITAGRRYGKTVTGGLMEANVLRQHGRCAWVVPTYKNGRPCWRMMDHLFRPYRQQGIVSISKAERVITTHLGGFFAMFSADNIDAMLGEYFHLIINDEAARISEQARFDIEEPCVADTDGEIVDISTPKGRNWFWREHIKGQNSANGEQVSFHRPSNINPIPQIQRAFKMAGERLPEMTFRQEWLAEFLEHQGAVFRNIDACMNAPASEPGGHEGHHIVAGIDWGKQADFTAISVGCRDCGHELALDRFNQIDYIFQRGRLKAMIDKWRVADGVAETNAMGEPNLEMLQREGLPIRGFTTTATTKPQIIQSLALALEREEFQFLSDPVARGELEAYEQKVSPTTGRSQYSAPDGMHDDTVIARALMIHSITSYRPAIIGG